MREMTKTDILGFSGISDQTKDTLGDSADEAKASLGTRAAPSYEVKTITMAADPVIRAPARQTPRNPWGT